MNRRRFVPVLATTTLLLLAAEPHIALAQGEDTSELIYEFGDDELLGEAFGTNHQLLRVRPGPVRTLLLRPRTQFVREMQKSVEAL